MDVQFKMGIEGIPRYDTHRKTAQEPRGLDVHAWLRAINPPVDEIERLMIAAGFSKPIAYITQDRMIQKLKAHRRRVAKYLDRMGAKR